MNKIKLKLAGKEYDLKFGLLFLENLTKGENLTIEEVLNKMQENTLLFMPVLLMYAVNSAGGDMSREQTFDLIDEVGINNPELIRMTEAFVKSLQTHIPPQPEGKPKAAKKAS